MPLKENIITDLVELNAPYKNRDEIFIEIARLMERKGYVEKGDELYENLLSREDLMTTGIGKCFAIPHAFSDYLKRTVIAFISLTTPVDFAAIDNKPVKFVFMLLGPKNNENMHLLMLSQVSRLISNDEFVAQLETLKEPQDFIDLVEKFS